MFEEWGWRGYLEPRLAALGVPDPRRHLPIILSPGYTEIPYAIYFPLFAIAVILAAIVYGQLQKASGTVWTSVLIHGIANTFGSAINQNNLMTLNNKLLAGGSGPESILSILLWGALAWWMLY